MFIPIVHRRATPEEIREKIRQHPLVAVRELLPDKEIYEACHRHGYEFRQRLYGPVVTVFHYLGQALGREHSFASSWQSMWAPLAAEFPELTKSGDTSGLTHARGRLPHVVMEDLARDACLRWGTEPPKRWNGYRLRGLDCATISMANEAELSQHFGHHKAKSVVTRYPLATLAVLLDLSTSLVVDYRFGPFDPGEKKTSMPLLANLGPEDLLLADRKYSGVPTLAKLKERGVQFLVRNHQRRKPENLPVIKRLGPKDFITEIPTWRVSKKLDPSLPDSVRVRIFQATWKTPAGDKVTEWFVTSLKHSKRFPKEALANLYHKRWQHETAYFEFKVTCQADILRSKTVDNIYKEMAAHILAYQLVRQLIVAAAIKHEKSPTGISFLDP